MAIEAGTRLGRYEIRSKLGEGGMGEVYLAQDTNLDRKVALKILPVSVAADRSRMNRFVLEARAASALNHPNIITIHEIDETGSDHFIATEFIDGQTLRERMRSAPVKLTEVLEVAAQIASALAAAHAAGIVHRDIKPDNIMLRRDGIVKVLDFGLAKLTDSLPPQSIDPEVPAELERIVAKSLRKDRDERYQNIKDLLLDLKSLKEHLAFAAELERSASPMLEGKPAVFGSGQTGVETSAFSTARPTSSAEYLATGIKQHKLGLLIAVIAIAAVIVAGSLYLHRLNPEVTIESIAVLPFVNQNNDPNTDYLSDGIPEGIINRLSQLPNLKVMSRNSVFHYKGKEVDAQAVAKELRVQAVLTGRLTQRGDALSISVELINAQDNSQIWGQQYNRKLADMFAVQEEIAKEISEKLRLKLSGAEKQQLAKRPTENPKAFQYYIQSRAYAFRRTRDDLLTAIRYCDKAIEEDPNYAPAYAGLADAYTNLASRGYIAPQEGRRKTQEAADRALALDDNLAEAHAAQGQANVVFAPFNFSLGDRELRRAIELSPSLASARLYLGNSLARQGHPDEGLEELLKARELDPLSPIIARQLAGPYYLKRDYECALELMRQANELSPAFNTSWEVEVYIQNRLFNEALTELEKAKRERDSDSLLIYSTGMVYAAQGKRAEALTSIKELEAMSGAGLSQAYFIARIYLTLNEKDLCLTWLERGLSAGAISVFTKDEPIWDPIRSDPRYAELVRRMGFPP